MKAFIVLDPKDNVGTALLDMEEGFEVNDPYVEEKILCRQKIPMGHKFAVKDIKKGETAFKYGTSIGVMSADVSAGEHVHVHNLLSRRGKEKAGE